MAGDGVFRYRDGIAVVQVAAFSAALAFGVYFKFAHRIGWFCVGVFSLFRVVGASCMLATINNDSDSVWAGVFVCESLGIILLLFLLLELLERVNKVVPIVLKRVFIVPQIITWADIGVSIAGFVAIKRSEHPLEPTAYSKAGITLLAVIYLWIAWSWVSFWRDRARIPAEERRAVHCVAACLPLLAVRVVYPIIYAYTANMIFNAIKGDSTAYLFMTFLPELGIVGICTWTIMKIQPLPASKEEDELQGQKQVDEESRQGVPLVQNSSARN